MGKDPSFKVFSRSHFRFGRVFEALWSEPENDISDGTARSLARSYSLRPTSTKIRRHIVIQVRSRFCTCLNIHKYDSQGVSNTDVDVTTHTIIYNEESPPMILDESKIGLLRTPLKVNLYSKRHGLGDFSRLDYGESCVVEFRRKVRFIGEIDELSQWHLAKDFNQINPPLGTTGIPPPNAEATAVLAKHMGAAFMLDQDKIQHPLRENSRESYDRDKAKPQTSTDKIDLNYHSFVSAASTISQSSSEESLLSAFSYPSRASPAATEYEGYKARLEDLLLQDQTLRELFREAVRKMSFANFQKNFTKALEKFSQHLRVEESLRTDNAMTGVAKTIGRISERTAFSIAIRVWHEVGVAQHAGSLHQSSQEADGQHMPTPELEYQHKNSYQYQLDQDEIKMEDSYIGIINKNNNVDAYDDVDTVESALLQTNSFVMLRQNLRLILNSNQAERAVFDLWPVSYIFDEPAEIIYCVAWDVPDFLTTNSLTPTRLGQLLTITSDGSANAQAMSCEDYLASTWPDVGFAVLLVVQKLLDNSLPEHFFHNGIVFTPSASQFNDRVWTLKVEANYWEHVKVVSILSWLSSVFRNSPPSEISRSIVSVRAGSEDFQGKGKAIQNAAKPVMIKLRNLERLESSQTCWYSLFTGYVVAEEFPIRERSQGVGLEISFADIVATSRCLSFVEYEQGLIAHGLSAALIPMKELHADGAIQWHFEDKTKQGQHALASIAQILRAKKISEWYRELDPKKLFMTRCFLGWAEIGNVVLGTSKYHSELAWSGAERSPSIRRVNSYSFTMGVDILGIMSAKGSVISSRVCSQAHIVVSQRKDVYDILEAAKDHYVFLYDNGTKIGWCIPRISFILQMAHTIVSKRGYQFYSSENIVIEKSDMLAQPTPDAVSSAYQALQKCFQYKVRKDENNYGPVEENFKDIIEKSWHTLNDIGDSLAGAESDFSRIGRIAPNYIHGVEFVDVINMETSMPIKQARVNQPWTLLTTENGSSIGDWLIHFSIIKVGFNFDSSRFVVSPVDIDPHSVAVEARRKVLINQQNPLMNKYYVENHLCLRFSSTINSGFGSDGHIL